MKQVEIGVPLSKIRQTIENKYRPRYGQGTPTPPVPAAQQHRPTTGMVQGKLVVE